MGKVIKKYKDFLKLNEGSYDSIQTAMNPSAAFGLTDLSTINTGGSISPKDPNLSFNAWDKHKANMRDNFTRMSGILNQVFAAGSTRIGKEFEDNIEDLTIVRLYRNNNGSLDLYIKFLFMEEIFYATFQNWGGYNEPIFKSSITKLSQLMYNKDTLFRLIGLIKDSLDLWFSPTEDDNYRALKDIKLYNQLGQITILPQGGEITVEEVTTQDKTPIIYLTYNNMLYTLTGLDYFYFNWWFRSEEKRNFYL